MGEFRIHHARFFEYTPSAINNIVYDENQDKLALSRSDGSIEIWSIKDNWFQEKILVPEQGRSVEALAWCQGRLFSAGLHGDIHEHDLVTLTTKSTVSSNSGPIWCLSPSADGKTLAAGTEDGCVVLFDVTDDQVWYSKALDKQEGRILCLAWHEAENVIVTGGVDNIRVWNLKSGHAVQRLTLGRQEKNRETIVWAIGVTRDFTIVSGDSRGKTCFWSGKQGTLIKSFQVHKADVLCLCISEDGNTVISSGIDPKVAQFEYTSVNPNSNWNMWVRSSVRFQHSHDVRAVAIANNSVVSGGVDCQLIINQIHGKEGLQTWKRIAPVPQSPLVCTAKKSKQVLLRHPEYLELWCLGDTSHNSEKNGEILKLSKNAVKLLQLKSSGDHIVCAAISQDASWVAYSDINRIRIFNINIAEKEIPNISVNKVRHKPSDSQPAQLLSFTESGDRLVSVTPEGAVQVMSVDRETPEILHTFNPIKGEPVGIHLLTVCPNDNYIAIADHNNGVHVYDIKDYTMHCSLPRHSYQPCAMCFNPSGTELLVAYTDQKILEFNLEEKEYTGWSRQNQEHYPPQWLRRYNRITQISYIPHNPKKIILHDDQFLTIIDKTQPFPGPSVPLFSKGGSGKQHKDEQNQHAFHTCSKFKYILHLDVLADDFLLLVERPPLAIVEKFPPTFKQKKFGT